MSRGAAAGAALAWLTACGGAHHDAGGIANRGGAAPAPATWTCPPGAALALDLDGDGRDDEVRLAPDAAAVTCLEIHATTAPPLRCDATSPATLDQLESEDGRYGSSGTTGCDPMGARVRPIVAAAGSAPAPRRSELALLGEAAPTGTALWLDGGDASAAITWHGGRWAWIAVGF